MKFNQIDFDDGVKRGTNRMRLHFKIASLSLAGSDRAKIDKVLSGWPHDLSESFVELFAEMSTLASLARSQYNEPPLTDDELKAFLTHSTSFFNSLKHRVVDQFPQQATIGSVTEPQTDPI